MNQSRLNQLIEKSISNTNVISKSLPDKEFLKFWKLMLQAYGGCLRNFKPEKIKVLNLYQKVKLLTHMASKCYAEPSQAPVLSKHLKYNLYFESFTIRADDCSEQCVDESSKKNMIVSFSKNDVLHKKLNRSADKRQEDPFNLLNQEELKKKVKKAAGPHKRNVASEPKQEAMNISDNIKMSILNRYTRV